MYRTTARRLLDTMAAAKANPKATIKTGIWSDPYWTGAQARIWFWARLDDKINRNQPPRGRKHDAEYQQHLAIDARAINDYYGCRLRHRGCRGLLRTPEMRRRYPHINNQERE